MRGRVWRALCPFKNYSLVLFLFFSVLIVLLHKRHIHWRSFGLKVSSVSVLVLDCLRDAIFWPETPLLKSKFSLNDTSDPAHRGSWQKSGGDFLLARLHNRTFLAGVAGHVEDHHNGSYSAVFSLLWEGNAQVEVTLVHPSEAVTVLQKLTQEQPDRIYFQSFFRSGSVTETTTCNICLNANQQKLCNYTDINTGEPWFCYKPKILDCDLGLSSVGRKDLSKVPLFGYNKVGNYLPGCPNIYLLLVVLYLFLGPPGGNQSTVETRATGYYYQGAWQALDGTAVQQFNSTAISQCLKGKTVYIYGDSTVRQWYEYLTKALPELKEFDLQSSKQTGPCMALDFVNKVLLTFRSHGPPIRFGSMPVSQLHYIANELDRVAGGSDTLVVIGIWSHFSTFPIEVYIRRLLNIRRAVVRLLTRAPATMVIIRTANPKELTLYETLTNSDWFSLQRDKVLRAIFEGVNVRLVDAWEMILAHHLPHKLHPESDIIKNMVDVLLSYICPIAGSFKSSFKKLDSSTIGDVP
uniref:Neurexophilin and PC-esterase domain family member 3 n=1 Tax=Fundulus heteroclitus TaxID=8078 RepID=A0A3Q2PY41_FUNHE